MGLLLSQRVLFRILSFWLVIYNWSRWIYLGILRHLFYRNCKFVEVSLSPLCFLILWKRNFYLLGQINLQFFIGCGLFFSFCHSMLWRTFYNLEWTRFSQNPMALRTNAIVLTQCGNSRQFYCLFGKHFFNHLFWFFQFFYWLLFLIRIKISL